MTKVTNTQIVRANQRDNIRKKNKILRSKNKEELLQKKYEIKKNNGIKRIYDLISGGTLDCRLDKNCPTCKKKYIKEEEQEHILKEDETMGCYVYHKDVNKIFWRANCKECAKEKRSKAYRQEGREFDYTLASSLIRHINGNMNDKKIILEKLRQRSKKLCEACSVQLVRAGGVGRCQESITDMYPINRKDEATSIDELAIVCLACQSFQNQLNWDQFQKALFEISNSFNVNTNSNTSVPLTPIEKNWLWISAKSRGSCPYQTRLKIVSKCGRYCKYTGIEVVFESNKWNSASFDRINSKLEYTEDQTSIVCKHINYIKKNTITEEQLIEWIEHIRKNKNNLFQINSKIE